MISIFKCKFTRDQRSIRPRILYFFKLLNDSQIQFAGYYIARSIRHGASSGLENKRVLKLVMELHYFRDATRGWWAVKRLSDKSSNIILPINFSLQWKIIHSNIRMLCVSFTNHTGNSINATSTPFNPALKWATYRAFIRYTARMITRDGTLLLHSWNV